MTQKPTLTVLLLCTLIASTTSGTDQTGLADAEDNESFLSRFEFHGYLNLGYGTADGHKHRGIPEGGTGDLHTVALQLRFNPSAKDELVLQLANERIGTSPSNDLRDDVEIDWLYYHRRLSDRTSLKVGRVPLPIGIYNETKDVGTLLPFYRPSGVYYGDGTWTSDSIDGLVFSHAFAPQSDWRLDSHLYFGEWERIETSGSTLAFDVAEIEEAKGFWLWLNTPVSGLRFGLGANHFHATGGVFLPPGVSDTENTSYFSIDADFERVVLRMEASKREFTGGNWTPFYLELDVALTPQLRLAALYDTGELFFEIPFFATFDGKIEEIFGVGLRYFFKPNLVVKLEHQWFEGFGQIEDQPLNIFFDEPVKTNILILSASISL